MKTNKKKTKKVDWLIPAGLILLSLVPVFAGATRLVELSSSAGITPDNARFFASPIPVVLHIISVSLFCILGAFQFTPRLRRPKSNWHRITGWLLIPSGLIAALSGLWMTQFYPWPEGDGELLYVMRLFFGSAMLLSIIFSVVAIRRRDFISHSEWMMRGYAIGLGAGTQVLTHLPWFLFFGPPNEFTRAMLMGAGWAINLAVAEWVIRKQRSRRQNRSRRTSSVSV